MEKIKVMEKGTGISNTEELSIVRYTEEALKDHSENHSKFVHHVSSQMSNVYGGKWTVLIIESNVIPWEIEFFPAENKHIEFVTHDHTILVYKCA